MKATKDNAVYIEKAILQDNGDTDFAKVTDTTVNYLPNEISLLDTTTNTQLESEDELTENEDVLLIDTNNNITDTPIGSVTTGTIDTTQILDVFGDNSCVAAYPFDENANDLSGNYNGTWKDADGNDIDGTYEEGVFGQCAVFDATKIIKNESYHLDTNSQKEFTISLWFNQFEDIDSYYGLFTIGENNGTKITVRPKNVINGTNNFILHNGDASVSLNPDIYININQTYNLCLIFDFNANIGKIYFDGKLTSTADISIFNNIDYPEVVVLGGEDSPNFKGLIDQVRIFNRALTDDEVKQLYNEQRTKYIADISSANLSETPAKAFKKQLPDISIACEATAEDITDTSFTELEPTSTTYDGSKFTTVYSDFGKEGRAIQRKITAHNAGMEVIEPFTSNIWKKDS